jgi:divalent metal cation (Fe/Co/Zn/Cd) transporter
VETSTRSRVGSPFFRENYSQFCFAELCAKFYVEFTHLSAISIEDTSLSRKRRRHGDFYKFILLVLLKEGSLDLAELEKKGSILVSQFELVGAEFGTRIVSSVLSKFGRPAIIRRSRADKKKSEQQIDIKAECQELQEKGLITLNQSGKYDLTAEGEKQAIEFEKGLKKGADVLEGQFLSPSAAARNTVVVDFFLAVLKLLSGFFSGSVGLCADGADAAVDTVSAAIVWLGMKIRREYLGTLIVLLMMFVAGISIGYDSLMSVLDAFFGTLSPLAMPYLVIVTEIISLIFAALLFIYQRFVGKRTGSLALISQSVDSKNHIYVAAGVIVGAVFSIFGIHFLDALIGGFVAVRILVDGIGLSKETFASIKGDEVNLEKYEFPFESHWRMSKVETFRTWILYSVKELGLKTRNELVTELTVTFKPEYIPVLSEYKFRLGEGFNFDESFNSLVNPLFDAGLLTENEGKFLITVEGEKRITDLTRNLRFLQ